MALHLSSCSPCLSVSRPKGVYGRQHQLRGSEDSLQACERHGESVALLRSQTRSTAVRSCFGASGRSAQCSGPSSSCSLFYIMEHLFWCADRKQHVSLNVERSLAAQVLCRDDMQSHMDRTAYLLLPLASIGINEWPLVDPLFLLLLTASLEA